MTSRNDPCYTADDFGDDESFGVQGPSDPWYHAQIKDWLIVNPLFDRTCFHLYAVLAALVTKQTRFAKRITKDQLRWLMPGIKGKPVSKTTLDDALRKLDQQGIVTIKRGSTGTTHIRNRDGTFSRHESFVFRVADTPPDAASFDGWVNVWDKLDDYPGLGWDKDDRKPWLGPARQRQAVDEAEENRDRNSGHGSDQQEHQEPDADGADPPETEDPPVDNSDRDRNSGDRDRNSGDRDRNSGQDDAMTSENRGYQDTYAIQPDKTLTGGPAPLDPPEEEPPPSGGSSLNTADQSGNGVTTQRKFTKDHLHARARAGQAAIAAITTNPDISQHQLEQVISGDNPRLSQGQVVGRAARLLAWEHHTGDQPATAGTNPTGPKTRLICSVPNETGPGGVAGSQDGVEGRTDAASAMSGLW